MIDRHALLSDLQAELRKLEADLRERHDELPDVKSALTIEFQKARENERTAQNYEDWLSDYITQVAAAWVLSCVFVRFLEDNQLIDPPRIAGPGERLKRARDEHEIYFRAQPTLTDRDYLLSIFNELAALPGTEDVFGEHNLVNQMPNWLGPDAAGDLLKFFQRIEPDTGELVHDFTDHEWDTRFLGDLYQDLSEAARKKYALLQTPEFVEEFILDRTLDPALEEFGLYAPPVVDGQGKPITEPGFRMIDPACGSGHFLLGAFRRILKEWQRRSPGTSVQNLVQKTLDSIHGVDINPFAIAIARFRLLLAALAASNVRQLTNAPGFHINLACGDSLYHGRELQHTLGYWTAESHYFRTEDAENIRRILREGTFHTVVANPPYITVKDKAANRAYRRLYSTCHMKYSLAVPFMERILQLALTTADGGEAGYTGQITANSFMKREFGKKLIEDYFPTVDVSHVIDTQLAHIPGHGIPTVIVFARPRTPQAATIRVVGAIKREDEEPRDPAKGLVWNAIVNQVDLVDSKSDYISVSDTDREVLRKHPWSIGGGGAAALKQAIEEQNTARLSDQVDAIGFMIITGDDDLFVAPEGTCRRHCIPYRHFAVGDEVRDWGLDNGDAIAFMYSLSGGSVESRPLSECVGLEFTLWPLRTNLKNRLMFGKLPSESGIEWHEYRFKANARLAGHNYLAYSFVATHNHFIRPDPSVVFNHSAMLCVLPPNSPDSNYLSLLTVLNSSTLCFWMKQVCHCKGGGGIGGGIAAEAWERFYEVNGTKLKKAPLPTDMPKTLRSETISALSCSISANSVRTSVHWYFSSGQCQRRLNDELRNRRSEVSRSTSKAIRLQEDLDWECYRVYGLLDEDLTYPGESHGIELGERAFEIVLARKMARGEVQTSWFERHGSTPITELPGEWPDNYRRLVQRRIEVIESNPQIALIEKPEYKRRWNTEPWDSQVERALRSWLLDRLERYFDFDGRMSGQQSITNGQPDGEVESHSLIAESSLISIAKLTDAVAKDKEFLEVGEVYRDDPAFDVQSLVKDLVQAENVPLLPVLRYKPSGLRKRTQWERTWDLQRREDAIDARTQLPKDDQQYLTQGDAREFKQREIGDIPAPPKYTSADFISTGGARYWALRGKLDVSKERWVSFPHCDAEDGSMVIAWAGYDHLQLSRAVSAYYVEIQEHIGGRDDPRLVPLLGCLIELLPWLKQWHNDIDPEFDMAMGDYFEGFIQEEARQLGKTIDEMKEWEPPKKAAKAKRRKGTKGNK